MHVSAEFVGLTTVQLQQRLTAAQQAIHDLTVGGKPETAALTQGDGSRSVTYTKANLAGLEAYVSRLAIALGLVPRRRPVRPFFQ